MCTYNGEKYLKEQLVSLLEQSLTPHEIVICDDGSTDYTIDIAKETLKGWEGEYSIIKNEKNLGFTKNFEKAIGQCTGDYIFLCDQDDVWHREKIELVMQVFKDNPHIGLVFHDAYVTDDKLKFLEGDTLWDRCGFIDDKQLVYNVLHNINVVQGCSTAIRREVFDTAYPFPREEGHDYWLFITAMLTSIVKPFHQTLVYYRQHQNNLMGAGKRGKRIQKKSFTERQHHLAQNNIKYLHHLLDYYKLIYKRFQSTETNIIYNRICPNMYCVQKRLNYIKSKSIVGLLKAYVFDRNADYTMRDTRRDIRSIIYGDV